jgi:Bacterial mobilisation protein (MobC)
MAAVKAVGLKPAQPPRRKPNVYEQALAAWTDQLGRIGNNTNQIARVLNSGGSVASSELSGIETELRMLREAILAFDHASP